MVEMEFESKQFYLEAVLVTKSCPTLASPWTAARQAPLSMGFSRQECWSGLPFLLQGIFPTQELNPGLPHYGQTLYHLSYQGSGGVRDNQNWVRHRGPSLTPCDDLEGWKRMREGGSRGKL